MLNIIYIYVTYDGPSIHSYGIIKFLVSYLYRILLYKQFFLHICGGTDIANSKLSIVKHKNKYIYVFNLTIYYISAYIKIGFFHQSVSNISKVI